MTRINRGGFERSPSFLWDPVNTQQLIMSVRTYGENIEMWRNLTQDTTPAIGAILNRIGVCVYKGTVKIHIRRFYYVSFWNHFKLFIFIFV